MSSRPTSPELAVWAWTTALGLAATAMALQQPFGELTWIGGAVALGLTFVGNAFRIELGTKSEEGHYHAINWGEVAAVAALAFCSRQFAIAATFFGVLAAQAHKRKTISKALLNASAYAFQMGLAMMVVGRGAAGTVSWSLFGAILVFVGSNLLLFEFIYPTIGVKRTWRDIRTGWLTASLISLGTSMMALIGVELVAMQPLLLAPYVTLAFAFVRLNRQNLRMAERFERTEHLYDFTKTLTTSKRKDGPLLVAESIRDAVRARSVSLVFDIGDDTPRVLLCSAHDGRPEQGWVERHVVPAHLKDTQTTASAQMRILDDEHVITAPLPLQDRIIGAIAVVEPSKSGKKELTDDDVRLIETMAQHAAIWLDNERLVDELRIEVAQREHEAFHDALTDLPNRRLFNQRAGTAIEEALANELAGAVMLLDLDQFKEVNDALGHVVGDELLLACGNRIQRLLPTSATLARLGGDEFAILLPTIRSREEPETLARAISAALDEPMPIRDMNLRVDASIGIAYFPDDATDASVALQRADVAMYTAKQSHSVVELYSTTNDFSSSRKLALQADLKRAIGTDQIQLWYQPKVRLSDNEVMGVECLVRWAHPTHGMVYPDQFIPQAEQSGLIGPLSMQILDTALRQQRRWKSAGTQIKVAVNLSVRNLLSASLARDLDALLDAYGTLPGELVIEITETAVMSDPERAKRTLRELHDLGVHLAVDDFGIGQSSLAYLQELPIDEVKIDRCFVNGIERGDGHDGIARTVVDLGRNLGLVVVAEGVETLENYEHLRSLGCEIGQGYFIGRPMPVEALEAWLANGQTHLPAPSANQRVVSIGAAARRRRLG